MQHAIVLVNMGGPTSKAQVQPYLKEIFRDPAILALPTALRTPLASLISRRRAPEVAERYDLIGGSSPLYYWTERLCGEMRTRLDREQSDCVIRYAFRYSSPTIEETLIELDELGVDSLAVVPLFPHYTRSMTGSVEQEIQRVNQRLALSIQVVPAWGDAPEIVELYGSYIKDALTHAGSGARVLFVAHGIPQIYVRRGDEYPTHVERAVQLISAQLPANMSYSLAYQSKVGPVAWTQPYMEAELARLTQTREPIVIVPLSFAADCLETQYDLDIVARDICEKRGVPFSRARVFNDDPRFAAILLRLVLEPVHV